MQTNFTPEQLADPATARVEPDPADLRALRLLHRDLPDLSAARRRARQPARAHLPDQGHAGERPAGRREDRQAHRPLPVLPRLHDDLPVGRALHAPRRPRPRPYRGDLPPAAARARCCAGCWRASCPIRRASGWRCCAARLGRPFAGADAARRLRAMLDAGAARACRRRARSTRRRSSRPRARAGSGSRC